MEAMVAFGFDISDVLHLFTLRTLLLLGIGFGFGVLSEFLQADGTLLGGNLTCIQSLPNVVVVVRNEANWSETPCSEILLHPDHHQVQHHYRDCKLASNWVWSQFKDILIGFEEHQQRYPTQDDNKYEFERNATSSTSVDRVADLPDEDVELNDPKTTFGVEEVSEAEVGEGEEQPQQQLEFVPELLNDWAEFPQDEHHDRQVADEGQEQPRKGGVVVGDGYSEQKNGLQDQQQARLQQQPGRSVVESVAGTSEIDQQDDLNQVDQEQSDGVPGTELGGPQKQIHAQAVRNQGDLDFIGQVYLHLEVDLHIVRDHMVQLAIQPHARQELGGLPLVHCLVVAPVYSERELHHLVAHVLGVQQLDVDIGAILAHLCQQHLRAALGAVEECYS